MILTTYPTRAAPDSGAEPAWEVALLFPNQGAWSEEEYLALDTNRLVEFTHGNHLPEDHWLRRARP
jgi:hypothetical protein